MPTTEPDADGDCGGAPAARPLLATEAPTGGEQAFRDSFGEDLRRVLDVQSWHAGWDVAAEYRRIEGEVREAVAREGELQRRIRRDIFPRLADPATGLPGRGVYEANQDVLRLIHRGLLFNGGVEACDGTVHVHDTLPLTIFQVGVSLVSYRGDQGTWHQRLFRKDLQQKGGDPVEEALEILEQRSRRAALNHDSPADLFGELARKTLLDYGERAVLLRRSGALWRMGHGNPITYELLTGSDILELMVAGTSTLRELIEGHRKFVFVASEPRESLLLTIGQALPPLGYALVYTLRDRQESWFGQRRFTVGAPTELLWDGEPIAPAEWIPRFLERVASQVVVGVYRASAYAPAQLFFAHVDHAHFAAHIVLADSMFQEHRGFPLLIDLAHHVCRSVFGGSLERLTETAYASAGAPWRYFSERSTRGV